MKKALDFITAIHISALSLCHIHLFVFCAQGFFSSIQIFPFNSTWFFLTTKIQLTPHLQGDWLEGLRDRAGVKNHFDC
jgi:hypothetical protein